MGSDNNILVSCLRCKGKGAYERNHSPCYMYSTERGCPTAEHYCNPCDLCNGYGVLVATELKSIRKAEAVKAV